MKEQIGIWLKMLIVTTVTVSTCAVGAEEFNAIGRGLQEGLFTEADIEAYLTYQLIEKVVGWVTGVTVIAGMLWMTIFNRARIFDRDELLAERIFLFLSPFLPVLLYLVFCIFAQWAYLGDKADVLREAFETAQVEKLIRR